MTNDGQMQFKSMNHSIDQMKELSSKPPALMTTTQEEIMAEECRQRRAAEREGRRRRRQQGRKKAKAGGGGGVGGAEHQLGMSSDDELSTTDQASLGKIRQDVENQARQVMSDVVDDFATLDGKCMIIYYLNTLWGGLVETSSQGLIQAYFFKNISACA